MPMPCLHDLLGLTAAQNHARKVIIILKIRRFIVSIEPSITLNRGLSEHETREIAPIHGLVATASQKLVGCTAPNIDFRVCIAEDQQTFHGVRQERDVDGGNEKLLDSRLRC
jgi:hypothetical protein